ncbi:hypothetical protein L195_g002297 [Trifolium pratense]|uniref:Uncharacterized protein n=1 Tax=Trifolium pratense TaxID=57577 RepID=A0A2K3NS24_TRIPR|nr:hypothetical protein L195_g002297 [Trifolium pratense]
MCIIAVPLTADISCTGTDTVLRDITVSTGWMHHRSPPPPQPEVDEEVAADTITDFEIGIRPEAKDRIIQGTIPPSCDDDLSDDDYYQYDDDSQPDSYS